MKNSTNLFFILRNRYFRKIILFDKKRIYFILFLSLISTIIFSTFPLITQVYIKYLYLQESISILFNITLLFILLFLIKLIIDLVIEKYKTKYFEKVEKRIKELMIDKYSSNLEVLAFKKSDLFTKHIHLYLKLTKTIYYNIMDYARIITVGIIIFFFDFNLFIYLLCAVPIFVIFYLISKRIDLNSKEEYFSSEPDFGLVLKKLIDIQATKKLARKTVMFHLEENIRKRIKNKNRFKTLDVTMDSFISFFRIAYLCYFGIYIIISGLQISGLIVGLLFITLLMRPITKVIKSAPFYNICKKSFFKINSLYKYRIMVKNERKK